jgi:small neutral amino acid transporter SnatA (MarC family)
MDLLSAVVTLVLVIDPLGNVPLFLSILKTVTPERRRIVLLRVSATELRIVSAGRRLRPGAARDPLRASI